MDFLDYIYHHQWIAYLPGAILLAVGLLRLCAGAGRGEGRGTEELPRVVVTQRVPDPFEAFRRKKK